MHFRFWFWPAACALGAVLNPPAARAIIVYDAPNGLTTAPAGDQGWQFVGQWGIGGGVAIAPNWLITAQHFTNASNQFILNGVTYTRDQPLVDIPGTDLRLVHVNGTFPAYAPLFRKTDGSESGKNASLIGVGFHQHAANPDVLTGAIENGFFWAGSTGTRARGRNLVSLGTVGSLPALVYDFDKPGASTAVADEAALADRDSGGGAFIFDDGEWKLAGVHFATQLFYRYSTDPNDNFLAASIFDSTGLYKGSSIPKTPAPGGPSMSYSSRISPFLTQIDAATNFTAASTRYWDVNGATPGAGGATPGGNWNSVTANFNTDPTGAGAGAIGASPAPVDTVVFAAGADAIGAYTVNLSGTQAAGRINFTEGAVTIAGGALAVGAFDVSAGVTGTVTSTLAPPTSGVSKSGAGTLRLTKLPQSLPVTITAGTVRVLESSPGLSSGHPSGSNASLSRPSSLSISSGATLDLTNNDLIIDYSGASPAAQIEAWVASGYNVVGDWQGDGITSSVAALDGNYVLAVADNAALAAPFGTAQGGPLFVGVNVDLTTVLIKFTHRVDINLDGVITPDDAAIFGTNYDESITSGFTFAMGDLDFDGACTPTDAAIFGTFYDESLATLPEPNVLGVLVLALIAAGQRPARLHVSRCKSQTHRALPCG